VLERINLKHSLVSPILSGLVGLLAGFAVCVFLVRSTAHDKELRYVADTAVGAQTSSTVVRASDIEGHTLTVEDLLRCHHALLGKAFPEPFVPGVASLPSSESVATKYTDDDLRRCVSTLNSLAGLGNTASDSNEDTQPDK
jgi:hypothetical protein